METTYDFDHVGAAGSMAKKESKNEADHFGVAGSIAKTKTTCEKGAVLVLLAISWQYAQNENGTNKFNGFGVAGRMATESMTCEVDHFGVAECLANYHYQDVEFHPY